MFAKLKSLLSMIRFSHTIFALPFAMGIFFLFINDSIHLKEKIPFVFLLILSAMVGARSAAMSFNRIVDRKIDAKNIRTKNREIPSGIISLRIAIIFFVCSVTMYFVSAFFLGDLPKLFSLPVLIVLLGYSYTKHFTFLSHIVLGIALALSPLAVSVVLKGAFDIKMLSLFMAVMFWVAGFDIVYSLADIDFDRKNNLYSIPACFGEKASKIVCIVFHLIFIVSLLSFSFLYELSYIFYVAVFLSFILLLLGYIKLFKNNWQKSSLNFFFFNVNSLVSVIFFIASLSVFLINILGGS